MKYTGLTRRPVFIPSVGNFRQGMLVQLPLHLDALPGQPRAGDLHGAYAAHYDASNTPEQFVQVLPPTEDGKLEPSALNDTNLLEIRVFPNEDHRHAVVIARLDNLGKGASGAAVQNLKLMLACSRLGSLVESPLRQHPRATVAPAKPRASRKRACRARSAGSTGSVSKRRRHTALARASSLVVQASHRLGDGLGRDALVLQFLPHAQGAERGARWCTTERPPAPR